MNSSEQFTLWADGYDHSLGLSWSTEQYPFAGYQKVLEGIYERIRLNNSQKVLEISIGGPRISPTLYDDGLSIWSQDGSWHRLMSAKDLMPEARLFYQRPSAGIADPLYNEKFDAIILAYTLHLLQPEQQKNLIQTLMHLLRKDGRLYIGDIIFESQKDLENCKYDSGPVWDEQEEDSYFVIEKLKTDLCCYHYTSCSECAGILELPAQ